LLILLLAPVLKRGHNRLEHRIPKPDLKGCPLLARFAAKRLGFVKNVEKLSHFKSFIKSKKMTVYNTSKSTRTPTENRISHPCQVIKTCPGFALIK
jgi:hypothetical protein